MKFKLLGKRKPKAGFKEKTRIMENELAEREDPTEVVQPEQLAAESRKSGVETEQKGPQDDQPDGPVDRPAEQQSQLQEKARDESQLRKERREEIAAVLRQELADLDTSSSDQSESMPPNEVPDASTRWLELEPGSGPALAVEGEPGSDVLVDSEPSNILDEQPKRSASAPLEASGAVAESPEPPSSGDWEELDEEEEYQKDFVEPFSLLNNLIRENFVKPQVPVEQAPVVEVIGYSSDKQVLSYDQISRGRRYRIGLRKFELVRYKDRAACQVMFTDDFSGGVITGGRTVSVDELKSAENQISSRRGKKRYAYKLLKGDYANLVHEGGGSFVRFVNPPKIPRPSRSWSLDPMSLKILGSAFLAHVVLIFGLSVFSRDVIAANEADIDRFARVDMKDIQMDKPEEEAEIPLDQLPQPEQPPEQEEAKEEKKPEPKPKKEPKKKPARSRKRSKKKVSGGGEGGASAGAGMMAALGNISQRKSSQNIVAAVSNIDAVRAPGGRARYKLSGIVTKLPTSNVVVSRGRGVGVKAGIDLLRGGKGRGGLAGLGPGALRGGQTGRRSVGGVVFKAPKRKMRVRGHLSREAIAQVVKQHLREVQYCYEKNLLLNPNLAGKLIMEWTISISGSVSVVKTVSNTMKSPAVAVCITSKIKQWKFPRPKGGIVVVTYPFIFNSIGF